jgi:hypothetical protein
MKTFLLRHRIPLILCNGLICGALAFWFRASLIGVVLLVLAIYSLAKAIRWSVLG